MDFEGESHYVPQFCFFLQESIGLPEHTAADAAKVKGVQFPFVVSDRVMIKVIINSCHRSYFFLINY